MRTVRYHRFGTAEELVVDQVEEVRLGKGEVLVEVRAAGLNPLDGKLRRGELKLMSGFRFPQALGLEFSGVVLEVGADVDVYRAGDEVFGEATPSLSERVVGSIKRMAHKPAGLSFEAAAGLTMCGQAALQGLRDIGRIVTGQQVLIHGCTGGVGLFALQIARLLGAEVDGVCGTSGVELAHELGARTVVDYKRQKLSDVKERYDVVFNLSGQFPFDAARRFLTSSGIYVDPVPSPRSLLASAIANRFRRQSHRFLITKSRASDIGWLANRVEEGKLAVHVDRAFAMSEVRNAYRYLEGGGVIGKVVLRMTESETGTAARDVVLTQD